MLAFFTDNVFRTSRYITGVKSDGWEGKTKWQYIQWLKIVSFSFLINLGHNIGVLVDKNFKRIIFNTKESFDTWSYKRIKTVFSIHTWYLRNKNVFENNKGR